MRIREQGLTLLEVLIALSVVAIAMTAIIKVTLETIRGNYYLREKMLATWAAENIINKARLGLQVLPEEGQSDESQILILNLPLHVQGFTQKTPNAHIQELNVKVFQIPEHHLITALTSYRYAD